MLFGFVKNIAASSFVYQNACGFGFYIIFRCVKIPAVFVVIAPAVFYNVILFARFVGSSANNLHTVVVGGEAAFKIFLTAFLCNGFVFL